MKKFFICFRIFIYFFLVLLLLCYFILYCNKSNFQNKSTVSGLMYLEVTNYKSHKNYYFKYKLQEEIELFDQYVNIYNNILPLNDYYLNIIPLYYFYFFKFWFNYYRYFHNIYKFYENNVEITLCELDMMLDLIISDIDLINQHKPLKNIINKGNINEKYKDKILYILQTIEKQDFFQEKLPKKFVSINDNYQNNYNLIQIIEKEINHQNNISNSPSIQKQNEKEKHQKIQWLKELLIVLKYHYGLNIKYYANDQLRNIFDYYNSTQFYIKCILIFILSDIENLLY